MLAFLALKQVSDIIMDRMSLTDFDTESDLYSMPAFSSLFLKCCSTVYSIFYSLTTQCWLMADINTSITGL